MSGSQVLIHERNLLAGSQTHNCTIVIRNPALATEPSSWTQAPALLCGIPLDSAELHSASQNSVLGLKKKISILTYRDRLYSTETPIGYTETHPVTQNPAFFFRTMLGRAEPLVIL